MTKETISRNELFQNLNFKTIADDKDFKEDSVREVIILPILNALGYSGVNIVRSKSLIHPFLKTGSTRRKVTLVPDYILKVEDNFAWVLDAKEPNQKIVNDDNVEQVYSYAMHPEIRSTYMSLCNGVEFSLYRTNDYDTPILFFQVDDIETHWNELKMYLAPNSFQTGKSISYEPSVPYGKTKDGFDYASRPLLEEIVGKKRAARRHFGVHGYFTKQTWNVVAEYIKNYSKPGDLVLDPFGGSGVTAIEAMMNNRKAISIDLNPMPVFIVQSLIAPVKQDEFGKAFEEVKNEYPRSA